MVQCVDAGPMHCCACRTRLAPILTLFFSSGLSVPCDGVQVADDGGRSALRGGFYQMALLAEAGLCGNVVFDHAFCDFSALSRISYQVHHTLAHRMLICRSNPMQNKN